MTANKDAIVLVVFVFASLFLVDMAGAEPPVVGHGPRLGWIPLTANQGSSLTIFVNLASFRDPICPITVREMFTKASNPERVIVGAIEQHTSEEDACTPVEYQSCDPLAFCPKDNIRIRKWDPKKSLGPTFGRFVAGLMYRGELYYMMIDSHNRFRQDWDFRAVRMFRHTPGSRKVLSHYPNGYTAGEAVDLSGMMVMCYAKWIEDFNFTRNQVEVMRTNGHTRLQPFTAAGFLFTDAAAVAEVPFDPHLDFLFDGEELLYSVRLWTAGWDIYCPSEPLLFHSYDRHTAKRFWHYDHDWKGIQAVSQLRLKRMMKIPFPNSTQLMVPMDMPVPERVLREFDKFGLGKVRTVEQFWEFALIDPVKETNGYEFCRQLMLQDGVTPSK